MPESGGLIDALRDPETLGRLPAFRDLSTWRAWLTFLRAVYGLQMDAEDLALFQKHTRRSAPRPGGYPEAVAITGRQSGKSAVAALVASFEAATGQDRGAYALLVAQDERAVRRTLFAYARAPFHDVPAFAREVVKETADVLELTSGVSLAVYPCRPAAVRGVRAAIACVDELAFFTSTDGRPTDREMLRALRPTLATTGGKLLILSSPYGQSGALWDLHRQHFSRDDSQVLVWQASAPEMNPTLPADYIARMEQEDPEAYRSEVLGEFRTGISSLFDPDALDAVIARGRRELLPVEQVPYRAFADPSGGRSDAFALAIGHRSEGVVVVDLVRAWRPPFNPSGVVEEAAAALKRYGVFEVSGDKYAGEWPREAFRAHGVEYRVCERTTSENYLSLLPLVNAAAVLLPDVPELLRELRGLERRRGASGKDNVTHRGGAHDDEAAAVAGLASLLPKRADVDCPVWSEQRPSPWASSAGDSKDEDGNRVIGGVVRIGAINVGDLDASPRWRGWRH